MDNYFAARRKRNLNLSGSRRVEAGSINWDSSDEIEEGEELELEEDDEMELEPDEEYEEIEYDVDVEIDVDIDINGDKTDDENETEMAQLFYLDGKPFNPKGQKKKQSFTETHVRITTYLEKNVHQIIKILQQKGQIESITSLINNSIKAHLLSEYNNHKD